MDYLSRLGSVDARDGAAAVAVREPGAEIKARLLARLLGDPFAVLLADVPLAFNYVDITSSS